MLGYVRLLELMMGRRLQSTLPAHIQQITRTRLAAAVPQIDGNLERVISASNVDLTPTIAERSSSITASTHRCSVAVTASVRSDVTRSTVDVIELTPLASESLRSGN